MDITRFLTPEHREVLQKARDTYGTSNQILVSVEELCELAAVCTKYPRYGSKQKAQRALYDKALDEFADALIVLDHIANIFGLAPKDIRKRVDLKINRLNRWLNTSSDFEQTTIDRKVEKDPPSPCKGCKNVGDYAKLTSVCAACASHEYKYHTPKEEGTEA